MEVINIGTETLDSSSLNLSESNNSGPSSNVNFGSGIELLMNDKKRSSSSDNIKLDLGDLDNLEKEMNALSDNANSFDESNTSTTKSVGGIGGMFSGMFSSNESVPVNEAPPLSNDDNDTYLGKATRDSVGNTKTWDGYSKMNDIPVSQPSSSNLNDREKRRKKRMMLKKMEDWYAKGQLDGSLNYTMDSSYEEIEDEYETVMEDKRKKDSIKLQGWWFMTFINSIEYGNAAFNPFDLNLDGWGEQVSDDIDSYEDIFAELHDKYKGGKMAPELSLLLRVGFSAAVLNFSNKALSTATPAFNDVIKQSPELMKMFTNATVSSMSQNSPGFEYANNLMQDHGNKPRGPPPPAAVNTQEYPPPQRPGMTFTEAPSNRPDINASRGTMFNEPGVDMNNFQGANDTSKTIKTPAPRAEMKGPQTSDIDNILSGLKTRTVDIHEPPAANTNQGNNSMISISSLNEMQSGSMPKRSNRKRNNSSKNTIALDI